MQRLSVFGFLRESEGRRASGKLHALHDGEVPEALSRFHADGHAARAPAHFLHKHTGGRIGFPMCAGRHGAQRAGRHDALYALGRRLYRAVVPRGNGVTAPGKALRNPANTKAGADQTAPVLRCCESSCLHCLSEDFL